MGFADSTALESALNDLDIPASKDRIVSCAERSGASDDVLKALRALPLAEYDNMAEFVQSADLGPAAMEGQTLHDKNLQAREGNPRVAEHLRDTSR